MYAYKIFIPMDVNATESSLLVLVFVLPFSNLARLTLSLRINGGCAGRSVLAFATFSCNIESQAWLGVNCGVQMIRHFKYFQNN